MNHHLAAIKDAVIHYEKDKIKGLILKSVNAGVDPDQIINHALVVAMDVIGREFAASRIFVPEMLAAALTMKAGLEVVKPLLKSDYSQSRGTIVLATVKGDLHDIGKNLVGLMLEGAGFEVIDMGVNVDGIQILRKMGEKAPDILGLSALLTTTMLEMANVIELLSKEGLKKRIRVIVGGAPINAQFASEIGADGYGSDASAAVELCRKLLGNRSQ